MKYLFGILLFHLILLGFLLLALFDYAKIFLYEVVNILGYLGHPFVIVWILLGLFTLKVLEEVNSKVYLPQAKNSLIHGMVIYIMIFSVGTAYVQNELYYLIKKDYFVKFLNQMTLESKLYINGQLSEDKKELKAFASILKTVSKKPPHRSKNMNVSKPTKNTINIKIVNKSNKLTINFRQDNAWSYEYWVYVDAHGFMGQVHAYDIEKYIYYKNN